MPEHERTRQFAQSPTLNFELSLDKKHLTEEISTREDFVINEAVDFVWHVDHAMLNQVLEALTVETNTDFDGTTLQTLRPRRLPSKSPAQDSFVLLQKWEGVVTKVGEDSFVAQLTDLSTDGEDKEAEIPTEEIPPADTRLLAPGAVFYWCIGYLDTLVGQRVRASEIRFRRLPSWSKKELEKASTEAEKLSELLGWK